MPSTNSTATISSQSFSCATLLYKENCGNKTIQIALGAITALGPPVVLCSHFYPFSAVVWKTAIGSSAVSVITWKIFRSYSSSELDRKIDACTSFDEIQEIMDSAQIRISWVGTRHLIVDGVGTSTVDHIARRIEQEIAVHLQNIDHAENFPGRFKAHFTGKVFVFSTTERKIARVLVNRIEQLFDESEKNIDSRNSFTYLYYYFPRFFKSIAGYNDIRNCYAGEHPNRNDYYSIIDTLGISKESIKRSYGYARMPQSWVGW